MKVIVIGAVAGGATVASQLRRLSDAEITVYEKDRDMSFANCGLPYYLGGEVAPRNKLIAATESSFKTNKSITVKTYHEVVSVSAENKEIVVKDIKNDRTFTDTFDYLILSPGATQIKLPVLQGNHVFTLRNLEDTDKIERFITSENVKNILIIGGGYIGLEVIENLKNRGINITLLHRSSHLLKSVDADMTKHIPEILEANGVELLLNDEVDTLEGKTVHLKSGREFNFDMIITALGIKPNTQFIQSSGIKLTDSGHIKVNEYFETNISYIYALGDAIQTKYRHVDYPAQIALAWGAHRAANIIAHNIVKSQSVQFKGLLGTNIIRLFDFTFASVGITPNMLDNFEYEIVQQTQKHHAGYMPGVEQISINVYYDKKSRKILRASAFGRVGVDKRIDIIATAMIGNLTIDEFKDIEIAYSPVYSSPKDIINMLGYKAEQK
ncbi:CoA-disulfide reductase [Macrococcoides bohemicum]|uniref:CoA-disulfide reductase n=1 Tax=Macrococcoides bohemicum TaxID=1903056 RepID=A0AAJ4PC22_9STAP|nr:MULTISPECIES: CoA-disulfide reductase [Macrococcus]ATD30856.1 CoA-disulfide reductase [Macrococcus sp. IME1552]QYA43164.1 CoA-disulfide reductase [Macrococcus bohemicus]QYA45539.1 CoA-disulfide reductase [Macrococcus bohemicus]TDL39329.1 CoA-disulfide reductase [Macrococcus bohemicus]